MRGAFREPQRPLLFALAVLIHAGLFQLLVSERHVSPPASERVTALTFLPGTETRARPPASIAPLTREQLPAAPLPEALPPQLIAVPEREGGHEPGVDWTHEAGEAARKRALEAEAQHEPGNDQGPARAKPEFGWDRSRVDRVTAIAGGGILVRISDRCAIVITLLAMPACQIGKKPARGDLFEHMDDAMPGDWKDE